MVKPITINNFLQLKDPFALIDVRTPAEYAHGHVPGAFNLPLFSNEERVKVGTTYKQVGREEAILLGFDLTGSKWSGFIKEALIIAPDKRIGVHCWRGGCAAGRWHGHSTFTALRCMSYRGAIKNTGAGCLNSLIGPTAFRYLAG
ncbi:rhodanese-like domain-containing protein [Mucilaginibacter glaciei]|uniref:rhodanese-like domain-containing protein n=1 Tax=Mucilaginibacter glaciei TaxID=2772109 RepID=UPI00293BA050|nr:rhodanese-like domain-containing protein [Mucilaginibacter glaciei]